MFPLSVCIISKNEEAHIGECLARLAPYGFEIVLTDTGSTDKTRSIAKKYTDRIFHFDWRDDFSAARNFCLEKASHNWILSLDCDEYIEQIDLPALRRLLEENPEATGRVLLKSPFTRAGQSGFEQVRLSRIADRRAFHFTGAIHEQLSRRPAFAGATDSGVTADVSRRQKVYDAPVTILHVGYDGSEAKMQEKSRRNIALLEAALKQEGPDPYLYCQLGLSFRRLGESETALRFFEAGLAMEVDPALDYVKTMVESYGYTLLDLKRNREALGLAALTEAFSSRADFPFLLGLIYMNNGQFDQAVASFQKASTMAEFSVEGTNSYMAHYNIGVIFECTGRIAEAQAAYQKCGGYEPALARLAALRG